MASFLSLLNQASGKNGAAAPAPKAEPAAPKITSQSVNGVKRKAESDLQRPDDKARKLENSAPRDIKPLPHRSNMSSATTNPVKTNGSATSSSFASSIRPKSIQSNPKATTPNSKPAGPTARSVTATSTTTRPVNNSVPKAPSSKSSSGGQASTEKPAKRLTYKEKLALAEQKRTQAAGQIVHKPTVSMKERLAQAKASQSKAKMAAKTPSKVTTNGKAGAIRDGKQKNTAPPKEQYQGTAKPRSARPTLPAYQGTARPTANTQPVYRGTARPNSKLISKTPTKPAKKYERDEYLGTDEEEEGDEEDGYGYEDDDRYAEVSDDYSDMEAGFDDISDEEREAERAAKADDKREQEILDRHAAQKAARKAGRA